MCFTFCQVNYIFVAWEFIFVAKMKMQITLQNLLVLFSSSNCRKQTNQSNSLFQAKKMLKTKIFGTFLFCQVLSNKICEDCSNRGNEVIDWSLNDLNQDDPKLTEILQEKYLIRPNKKPLNLSRPTSNGNMKGQFGQPLILDEKYFR